MTRWPDQTAYTHARLTQAAKDAGIADGDYRSVFGPDRPKHAMPLREEIVWRAHLPDADRKAPSYPDIARATGRRGHSSTVKAAERYGAKLTNDQYLAVIISPMILAIEERCRKRSITAAELRAFLQRHLP